MKIKYLILIIKMLDEIENIIKSNQTYLYHRIINYINKISINYTVKNNNQVTKGDSFKNEIKITLIKYILDNNIGIEILNKEPNSMKEIEVYLNNIINFLNGKKEDLRLFHIKILKNLLISNKGKEIINNYIDFNNNSNIFLLNDFIINYSRAVIKEAFNKDFNENIFAELNNLYLYFIFKINDEEMVKKLKLLVYKYLYDKKGINEFIEKTSEDIGNKNIVGDEILKKFEIKYNEINFNINKVSNEIISFFGQNSKRNNIDLLNFFNPKNIQNNYDNITKDIENKNANEKMIVVDDLNYDENKIHLFSTEFLIANGLKSNLEKCDFEIYNEDNFHEDLYSKYLDKIIEEINISINKNDFIFKHSIKFHKNNFLHYFSIICDTNDKTELEKKFEYPYFNKRDLIKAKSNKNENKIEIHKEPNYSFGIISDITISSGDSFACYLQSSFENVKQFINTNLIDNISSEKLIYFPNSLYLLNLKIPKYNEKTNSIEFKSVHIDSFDDNKKFIDNNYYGCKNIYSLYQNNSDDFINFKYIGSFHADLKYEIKKFFEITGENEYNFLIYPKSLFFYDIKMNFSNISIGREKIIKIKNYKEKEIKDNIICYDEDKEEEEDLIPFSEYLRKLIKNVLFFLEAFKDNKELKNTTNIQIALIYDYLLIDQKVLKREKVKEAAKRILNNYLDKFKKIEKKFIFQLYFFDFKQREKFLEWDRKMLEDRKLKEEKNEELEEAKKQLEIAEKRTEEFLKKIKEIFSNNNLSWEEKTEQFNILYKEYKFK